MDYDIFKAVKSLDPVDTDAILNNLIDSRIFCWRKLCDIMDEQKKLKGYLLTNSEKIGGPSHAALCHKELRSTQKKVLEEGQKLLELLNKNLETRGSKHYTSGSTKNIIDVVNKTITKTSIELKSL